MAAYDLVCGHGEPVLRALTVEELAALAAAPQPRRLIPKSLIMARLAEAGLMPAAMAGLLAAPVQFGRWFSPDWPNVYADDLGLIAFLDALGADLETITAP
jgi:hypothetical protein